MPTASVGMVPSLQQQKLPIPSITTYRQVVVGLGLAVNTAGLFAASYDVTLPG
jgi:hypothetical protein